MRHVLLANAADGIEREEKSVQVARKRPMLKELVRRPPVVLASKALDEAIDEPNARSRVQQEKRVQEDLGRSHHCYIHARLALKKKKTRGIENGPLARQTRHGIIA